MCEYIDDSDRLPCAECDVEDCAEPCDRIPDTLRQAYWPPKDAHPVTKSSPDEENDHGNES